MLSAVSRSAGKAGRETMTEMIERVAEAIRTVNADSGGLTYSELTTAMARAAISAVIAELEVGLRGEPTDTGRVT